jgi:hypothetical protein
MNGRGNLLTSLSASTRTDVSDHTSGFSIIR